MHEIVRLNSGNLLLRAAEPPDAGLLLQMIHELADYEKLAHEVVATENLLRQALFQTAPAAEAVLAFLNDQPTGFALFFHNYSTFLGKRGLYLEDLFVRPPFRRHGIGRALLGHLARIARERNCGRFEWAVLDWNEPSKDFYRKLGAVEMADWRIFRLSGTHLDALAAGTGPSQPSSLD